MATPPFLPDETKPADGDVVSQYPAVERTFRAIIETWLLVDHDTAGEHEKVTLPELGADPGNVSDTGFLYTKDDGGDTELYYEDDAGNVVQITEDGAINAQGYVGVFSAPAGTSMLFYQTAAPAGWTKDTTTLNDHAIRVVSSTAWAGGSNGSVVFSTVFGKTATDGHTLTQAQLPNIQIAQPVNAGSTGVTIVGAGDKAKQFSLGSGSSHAHNMDIRLKYINVIRCTKDA